MNRYFPIILILFLYLDLSGQTQSLPDIRVTGDSEIKPHLQKRNLPLSSATQKPDSLQGYLPQSQLPLPLPKNKSLPQTRNGYLQAEGNTDLGISTYISYYPRVSGLRRISDNFVYQIPETNTSYLKNSFAAGIAMTDSISMLSKVDYFNSIRRGYEIKLVETSLDSHIRRLNLGSIYWHDISLQLAHGNIRQANLSPMDETNNYGIMASATTHYKLLNIETKYLNSYGSGGIYIAPALPCEPLEIKGLRIAIIADSDYTIPTLEFSSRTTLEKGLSLIIRNQPSISTPSRYDRLGTYPWLHINNSHKLTKTPLNLNSTLEMLKAGKSLDNSCRFLLTNNLSFALDKPFIAQNVNYGVASETYSDLLQNSTGFTFIYHRGKLIYRQAANLNLAYLTNIDYRRASYIPMYSIDTKLGYPYRHWSFEVSFSQLYNTLDHHGNSLAEALNLNFGIEYRTKTSVVYISIDNLLNRQQHIYTEYPEQGTKLILGLKQRF